MNRWTSVKTRLPKKPGQYLVCNRLAMWAETIHPSYWNYKDKRGKEWRGPEITHWMPMPKPPRIK